MIHSLSGGVIKSAGNHTFIKVRLEGEENAVWYLCDEPVKVGDTAVVEGRISLVRGEVIRVDEKVAGDSAPVPLNRIKTVEKIIGRQQDET